MANNKYKKRIKKKETKKKQKRNNLPANMIRIEWQMDNHLIQQLVE